MVGNRATDPAPAAATEPTCATCNKRQLRRDRNVLRCSGCKNVFYCDVNCQQKNWGAHRATCKHASLPRILVLLSGDNLLPLHPRVWNAVGPSHANISATNSPASALGSLSSSINIPNGILACGDSIFHGKDPAYSKLREALVDFVFAGGRVVVMGGSMDDGFDVLGRFLHSLGAEWKFGMWYRTTYEYNSVFAVANPPFTPATVAYLSRQKTRPSATPYPVGWTMGGRFLKPEESLSYYTKGSTLKDVPENGAVFVPTRGAVASLSRSPIENGVTSVAMKQVGTSGGWIGYVADTEMIDETVPIVLALLGCDLRAAKFV